MRVNRRVVKILNEYGATEVGYISIFITSDISEEDSFTLKFTLFNSTLNCLLSEISFIEIVNKLNVLREMVIKQSIEYGPTDDVFRGEDDTFYVACPYNGHLGNSKMECLLWLPESGPFKPMELMRRIREEFPYFWETVLF